MIVWDVIRSEGLASAMRRVRERIEERIENRSFRAYESSAIVNVAPGGFGSRTGGVAVQLRARLRVERSFRPVAVTESLPATSSKPIHLEGTSGVPLLDVLRLIEGGVPVVVSVHDLSLVEGDRDLARRVLTAAKGVIFPSQFLLENHREVFGIESGLCVAPASWERGAGSGERRFSQLPAPSSQLVKRAIAFAGALQRDKGGYLLPEIAAALQSRGAGLHVFGRGDFDLLRALRKIPNVIVHGYYRGGTLPSLLVRHGIGLVLVPSIVPEAFSLTISEAWLAGACVAAFDIGAQGERIRRHSGGWIAPLDSGAAGLIEILDQWMSGSLIARLPEASPTAEDAARAHLDLYRRWGLLP